MKLTNKQKQKIKEDEENARINEGMWVFFEDISKIFIATRELLALKKKAKKGKFADNSELSEEISKPYIELCEASMPVVIPYLQKMSHDVVKVVKDSINIEEDDDEDEDKQPIDKRYIN